MPNFRIFVRTEAGSMVTETEVETDEENLTNEERIELIKTVLENERL